ncbi:MAG: hypothetical protein GY771_16175, partial [bacterium]|nr:hypothetical protein [bacterium]
MGEVLDRIKRQQREWAEANGIRINEKGYVFDLDDNLFHPLSPESKEEFGAGAGSELDTKMKALHSSSALVANFFEYWRTGDKNVVTDALGLAPEDYGFAFEKTHKKPKGLGGIPPHLDVELYADSLLPIAIESKFCEPYYAGAKTLKKAYIAEDVAVNIWGKLSKCRELAERLTDGSPFRHLDAAQLLKHTVGLRNEYGENGFVLLYLWYEAPGEEAERHRGEMKDFWERVTPELDFRAMTYQELFKRVVDNAKKDDEYISYMNERYF